MKYTFETMSLKSGSAGNIFFCSCFETLTILYHGNICDLHNFQKENSRIQSKLISDIHFIPSTVQTHHGHQNKAARTVLSWGLHFSGINKQQLRLCQIHFYIGENTFLYLIPEVTKKRVANSNSSISEPKKVALSIPVFLSFILLNYTNYI